MKKFFHSIVRIFLLVTGFIPYIIFVKPKFFFVSQKAKMEYKKNRKGVLLISNHTKILDYYCFIFKKCFHYVHTMVAEVVYKNKFMNFLNSVMENIKIDRVNGQNASSIYQAEIYLRNNKVVLIFPEGKLEDQVGTIEKFNKTFAYLSLKTGKPIIPFFIDGRYGMFKRPTIVVGETIYPKCLDDEVISDEAIEQYSQSVEDTIKKLGTVCRDHNKVKTKTVFTKKYWILDFTRITSFPLFYLIFPTKKYYLGDKKKIRKALKDNVLMCANHCGPCDVLFIYMHFLSRRTRIITAEDVWCSKFLKFVLDRSGVIKYRRQSLNKVDLQAFKETIDTLNGKGSVAIFPEGHINFDAQMDNSFQGGAATFSLLTNSPILPFIYVTPYKYFRLNAVVYGDPIYPSDYFDELTPVDSKKISAFNDIIYNKMKELYDYSVTKRGKNYEKKKYFNPPKEDN